MTFYIVTMVRRPVQLCQLEEFVTVACLDAREYDCACNIFVHPSEGGDDHHCGVHFGCICVPHELQPQEQRTTGEPRG